MSHSLQTYRDLLVWQKAMDLAVAAHRLTIRFPREEMFGMTGQIRRAANCIPANTAERYGRAHRRDYPRFLSIAPGSLAELETHLILTVRVEIVDRTAVVPDWELTQEVGKLLFRLLQSLKTKPDTET
jgi:four helix bundle protein